MKETDRIETGDNCAPGTRRPRETASRTASRSAASPPGRGVAGIDAAGDHRIAMLGAVAGLVSREGVEVEGAEAAP